jgi:glycosyltransferase 2 family protein
MINCNFKILKTKIFIKDYWVLFLKILFTISVFVFAIYKYDIKKEFIEIIKFDKIVFFYIIFCPLLLSLINSAIQSIGFKKLRIEIGFKNIIRSNYIAPLFSIILPSTIGADAYLTYSIGSNSKNYSKVLSNIIFVRLLGLCVFLFLFLSLNFVTEFVILSKILEINKNMNNGLFIFIIITIIFLFAAIMIYSFRNYIEVKMRQLLNNIFIVLRFDLKFALMILLIIIWYFFSVGIRFLVSTKVGVDLEPVLIFTIIISINFVLMLPLTLLGIGVREVSYVGLFSLFGISTEQALIMAAADLLMNLVAIIFGGIIFSIAKIVK